MILISDWYDIIINQAGQHWRTSDCRLKNGFMQVWDCDMLEYWANSQVSRNCLHQNWQTVPVSVSNILVVVTAVRIVYFYDWQLMLILWQTPQTPRLPPATFGNFFLDRWYWGMSWWTAVCISVSEWEDRTGCGGREPRTEWQTSSSCYSTVSWLWLS